MKYTSRMAASHVSDHTTPRRPTPTKADFVATVYAQQWRATSARQSVTTFSLLALDDQHAIEVGRALIEAQYGAGALSDMGLVASIPRAWDLDALINHLEMETPAAWSERQDRFARQVNP